MSVLRPGRLLLLLAWIAASSTQLVLPYTPGGGEPLGSALLLFWVVVVAATGCVVTSGLVIARAWADDTAELGLHGAFFMGVSMLPLVHGLTTPGVLYGDNDAASSAVLWALPIASLSAAPLLAPTQRLRPVLRHWRTWVTGAVGAQTAIAAALLIWPSTLPAPDMGSPAAQAVAVGGGLIPVVVLSFRHLRLYEVGRHPGSLAVSLAYVGVGVSGLVWIGDAPMTIGFWLAHAFDITAVFLGTVVAWFAYQRSSVDRVVLAPLVTRDPLEALELGLDPVIRRFMADLAAKDQITQIHVVRTAETAMAVGAELKLPAPTLRVLGLGALLHDIGKLEIDDAVLNKPGRLTDEEFAHIRTHAAVGARLVLESPGLAELAPTVRHHHERIDGGGYPDGLAGDDIPLTARVVSVCDAYDAMVHTRQYREGLGTERAHAVLREHSGSQWDPVVVDALLALSDRDAIPAAPTVLADVAGQVGQSCTHELPEPTLAG
ncbi:MAG: HD-GYP domain-containing protein [Actinomycetota bacterium]